MRITLKALGCRLNEAELESWARAFQARGHGIAEAPADADLIVLNSCAVTQEAVRKSRQLIRRMHRENPRAKVVVSGCYASLNRSEAESLGVDLVVPNAAKDRLPEIAARELDLPVMPAIATDPGAASLFALGRQRAFVKVQDGCRYRCAFCIVTTARGAERSRPIAGIVAEINELTSQGIREVVLTGVHLGGYGSDLGLTLDALIRAVLEDTDVARLRLGSLEPWDLPGSFAELFRNPRFMPHLHLPLQSGCDATLRRMARRCKTADYARLADGLRWSIPDLNLTTDIIVGFPGESDEEWAESLQFIENLSFGDVHIFVYSPREGTRAAAMPEPVPEAVKKARSRSLHAVAEKHKRDYLARAVGCRLDVLAEDRVTMADDGRTWIFGYTPNYCRVALQTDRPKDWVNRIVPADMVAVDTSGKHLIAVPINP